MMQPDIVLSPEQQQQLPRVALKLFFTITEEWGLNDKERAILAGVTSRTTLHTWRSKFEAGKDVRLGRDTLERISYIAGIYKGLQLLYQEPEHWRDWVRRPNAELGGESALDRMLRGSILNLAEVRRVVDGWRGAVYG